MLKISMPRGDIRPVKFTVTDQNGSVSDILFDEIYFTVKRSFNDKYYVFQKKLSDGSIELDENEGYVFVIQPKDTDNLTVGQYVFDIELIYGNELKQTTVGEFILTNEVTFASNEV